MIVDKSQVSCRTEELPHSRKLRNQLRAPLWTIFLLAVVAQAFFGLAWAQEYPCTQPQIVAPGGPGKSGTAPGKSNKTDGITTLGRCPTEPVDPDPTPTPPQRESEFVSQSVPTTMVAGQYYTASVQMRNLGSATWTLADGYKLGSQSPADNWTWGVNRVGVYGSVPSAEVGTFNFTVRAPTAPGTYNFQWRMVDDEQTWFGATTPNLAITVLPSTVTGHIEGVSGNTVDGAIVGWACSTRIDSSIDVHLYVGGEYGVGTFVDSYAANFPSEPAVASACSAAGQAYRFRIPLSNIVISHAGKTIYIHGISPIGASPNLLANSGSFRIPINTPPSVAVSSPNPANVFDPETPIDLTATASDIDGTIHRVEFLINGWVVGTDYTAPYSVSWTGSTGTFALTARAFDNLGQSTTTSPVNVVIDPKPWVTLTGPINNTSARAPATLNLTANAGDNGAVASVEFIVNGQLLATDNNPPYSHLWAPVGVGSYTIQARATDNRGRSSLSTTASVGVVAQSLTAGLLRRLYVYDAQQRLCKVIEPETGATVTDYDASGNIAWSAAGLNLPDANNCNRPEAYNSGRRVDRSYDARNRTTTISFPDGRGNQSWAYQPDGAVASITTNNSNGSEQVINRYTYNKRRLLTGESVEQVGWYTWSSGYGYNANGHLAVQTFPPTGLTVDYAPNALGQATRAGTYATGVSYYPSGAVKQFTYGNGIVHTMTQNARQLPQWSTDSGVINYETSFDANGNTTAILDHLQGSHYSRWMQYDNADRLTAAGSCSFGGDCWHRFTYDALDNLKSWTLAGVKDNFYYYDPARNQLNNVNTSTGASIVGLEYDPQGNLQQRNGQGYQFDYGNRLREVTGKETYRYDGHGRRVLAWTPTTGSILSQYSQTGQLVFQQDQRQNKNIDHIYLAGSLVATREYNWGTGATSVRYQHTDALGSPVAVTNESGQVVDRTQFEPFGAAINKTIQGVGYTGHVMDAVTGLTYMQQRYYDPSIGRFLSIDPVAARPIGDNFNRYWYANNNPYKFIDPDGREVFDCRGKSSCASEIKIADLKKGDVVKTDGATVKVGGSGRVSVTLSRGFGDGASAAMRGPRLVPVGPRGVNVDQNMRTAPALSAFEFRDHVKNKGVWDYKQQGAQYEAFGNFHYGATGRSHGFPWDILLQEAGRAQVAAGTSRPEWGSPGIRLATRTGSGSYGDDPVDQFWIRQGTRYADEK